MAHALLLGISIFALLTIGYLTTLYDSGMCPQFPEWYNTTSNETVRTSSWTDYIWNSRCESLPSWYKLLIYTPLVAIALRSLY